MTQRRLSDKGTTIKTPRNPSQPLVDTWERFRFQRFIRCGFQAPDNQSKTRFSTYDIILNPGVTEDKVFDFLKAKLGMAHFPTIMAEFDGHITLDIFKAAELEGLIVLQTRIAGAKFEPLEERFRGRNPE